MSDAIASEAPSPSATSSHGTTEPIAIINGHKFFRVSDVCVALKTAYEVKAHLNAEVEKYVKETASKEQELEAWKQHCTVLARSLTAARRNSEAEKEPASGDEEDAERLAKEEKAAEAAAAAPSWTLGEAPAAFESVARKAAISGWMISIAEVKLGRELGVGTFGTTYMAQWRGATVAMKRIKPMENEVEAVNFLREVECLASVRHPHVLPFLGAVLQIPDSCWLLTDFMAGGTLAAWLHGAKGRRPKPGRPLVQRLKRGLEVARGMQALHESRPAIVHRDLKPSNVFVASAGHAVVGDLGLARRLPSSGLDLQTDAVAAAASTLTGETGTYVYMSPEMMRHEDYGTATDVWSWAVMMVELVAQRTPYEELFLTPIQVALGVSDYTLKPKIPGTLPDELCTLLHSCFDSDAEMRPPFSAIVPSLAATVEAMERQEAGGDNVLLRLFRQPGGLFQPPPASSDSASNPAAAAPVGERDNDDVLPAPAMSMEEPGPATDMRGGQLQQLDQNREGLGLPRGGAREYPAVSRAAAFFQGAGMKLGQVLRHPASRPAS